MPLLVRRMEATVERWWWVMTEKRRWRILSQGWQRRQQASLKLMVTAVEEQELGRMLE